MVLSSLICYSFQWNVTKERTNCTYNGIKKISFRYRHCYCGHKSCLIICFYGDHHQVVKCRKIHKHSVTCFSQFDFSKREISPLPLLNTVLVRDPFVKVASSCLQLWGFIPPVQRRLSNENKEEADGGKRQGKCTAVGEGSAWMLRQLLECGGCWKGKEGKE